MLDHKEVYFRFQIHCTGNVGESYRIWLNDNELLTERTWRWPINLNYIQEHVPLRLAVGNHKIHIESCNKKLATFKLSDFETKIGKIQSEQEGSEIFRIKVS